MLLKRHLIQTLPIALAIAPLQGRRSLARRGPDLGNEAPGCFSPTQKILGKLRQREKKPCMGLLFSFVAVQQSPPHPNGYGGPLFAE